MKETEDIMRAFVNALKEDKEKIPFLIRFIEQMTFDTMDLGSKGFQPIIAFTLFARQSDTDKVDMIFRPIKTGSDEIYKSFGFDKLGELIMEAFKQYGIEIWGMTPIDEKEEARITSKNVKGWLH